ncbi:TetR/AcrR family transcriptional regulator [Paraconexibacter sp.]|uniref:TetR/AcrR family transcriptional regulator n=1 Tax=Paraconexibacter sp. TaxID=2949640 RepID=UPI0035658557
MRRKPEVAEQEILDAAEALLSEVRFRDLTVDDVMARTAMKRSNFYTYFNDRNELVMRLVDRIAGEMFAATEPWLSGENPDRVAALRQGLRAVVRIWSQHAAVLAAMNEASHHDEVAQQFFRGGIVQEYIDRITLLLRREKRDGITAVRNPGETARALILLNVNYMTERVTGEGARPESVATALEGIWIPVLYPSATV